MNEDSILNDALRIADTQAREQFLREACGDDEAALLRIRQLLAENLQDTAFFDRPRIVNPTTATSTEQPGDRIGPYRLMQQIGEGGMGVVFVAEQQEPIRRKVALKVIKPGMDTKAVIARFGAERQALALMDHPNIAKVFDAGTTANGRPFFVMELVRGVEITKYCDEHKLTIRERLALFTSVCQAIRHAHQKGIIHRDIKPSNVLVTEQDGQPVPKVIDFGVAKAIGIHLAEHTIYTDLRMVIGTPLYMSPEQAASSVDVDTRSDVYSLGVLLYELLTGTTPFDRAAIRNAAQDEVLRIIREQEPPKPSTKVSTLGEDAALISRGRGTDVASLGRSMRGELDWIVMKALEKNRARRYESPQQLADDIENFLSGRAVLAGPPSAWYQFSKTLRRHRRAVASLLAVFLLLVTAAAGLAWKNAELSTALTAVRRAESEARSLNQFFIQDLLGQADPDQNPYQEKTTVVALLDRAAAEIQKSDAFAQEPEVEATIRLVIGKTYFALGKWLPAKEHLTRALAIRRDKLGPRDPKTLEVLEALVELHIELQDFESAEQSVKELESSWKAVAGEADPRTLMARIRHCDALILNGHYDTAELLAKETLQRAEQLSDADEDLKISARQAVADVLSVQFKDFEETRSMYERNLASLRQRGLAEHSHVVLTVQFRLAEQLIVAGRMDEAERLYSDVLRTRSSVSLPDDHPHTIAARLGVGVTQLHIGKFSASAETIRSVYAQALEHLGDESMVTWNARHALVMAITGGLLIVPNRLQLIEEAEQLALRNAELVKVHQWPEFHSNAHQARTDLALVLATKGVILQSQNLIPALTQPPQLTQATEMLADLYARSKQRRGDTHPLTIISAMHWLQVRMLMGEQSAEMEKLLRELQSATGEVSDGLPIRANLSQALGNLLAVTQRPAEAEPFLRRYFDFCRKSLSVSEFDRKNGVIALLQCLQTQNRWQNLQKVDLQAGEVYRMSIACPSARPIVKVTDGLGPSGKVSFENFDDDRSFVFVSAPSPLTVLLLGVSLAADRALVDPLVTVHTCDLTKNETTPGELRAASEKDVLAYGLPCRVITVPMKADRYYQIEVASDAFLPNLRVEDADRKSWKWLIERSERSAKLDFSPPHDGDYRVVIIPTQPQESGAFTFAIKEYTPRIRAN